QQQSSSSITPDEQSVMEEYAIINNELRSLNWSDAANLDEEGFGVWAKNRFTAEITTENDLNGLEELTLALQKRGDMATASKTRDTIRFKKKRTDWTLQEWLEAFPDDEEYSQEDIDQMNLDNKEWNDMV